MKLIEARVARSLLRTLAPLVLAAGLTACGQGPPIVAEGTDESTRESDAGGPESSDSPIPVEVMVDRIAYVSAAGDLFVIDPDGGNLINLTGGSQVQDGPQGRVMAQPVDFNNFYYWPTWSPDGMKLAASRVETTGLGPVVTVEVMGAAGGGGRTVYRNEVPSLVAQGAPHYLYWSPDSRQLAFLASTPQAFALLVADTQAPDSALVVETGAPLYFHWGAGGEKLLLHTGDDLKLAENPVAVGSADLAEVGQGFRVPALSPSGDQMAYISLDGQNSALFIAETGRMDSARVILEVVPPAAFAWSPEGGDLAVVDRQNASSPVFDRLRVVSADGGKVQTLLDEAIVAFFWSPQGDKIAWVRLQAEQRAFQWKTSAVDGADVRELFTYQPSADALTMLTFFDQYAYSHSPWSPDGARLVVAGTQTETFGRRNGETPRGDRVYILDAAGGAPPKELAQGNLAFWSWN
ncbi:MAG: hypothetical protein BZY80_00580 [SAR202 cluster bacterium Io17-Chloro-G2]|nr:MAG: hypothetical protein BZY80_00580 [SAR202 cluster bacterium Io17-Chloro-G2]